MFITATSCELVPVVACSAVTSAPCWGVNHLPWSAEVKSCYGHYAFKYYVMPDCYGALCLQINVMQNCSGGRYQMSRQRILPL